MRTTVWSFGGFGFGVWRTRYTETQVIWSVALGFWTLLISVSKVNP